ncbi:hypothetical protein PVL29_002444 [Vitis rotundifolia]|uniref:Uncharacterized protein n=1 Tax=Vitis rotundifolia TaxID=103349 RepID=A0AA39E3V1_VITRO|nr:hypothetical protein PVL29_002444 [Vitis rotundifolia]
MGRVEEDVTIAMVVVGASDGDDIPLDNEQWSGYKRFKKGEERLKKGSEKNLKELEREPEMISTGGGFTLVRGYYE